MRAMTIDRDGSPEVLTAAEVQRPAPGPGEVLVDVELATVNAIDWKTRAGNGVRLARFPSILGWGVCGTVAEVGDPNAGWIPGDQVFGILDFPTARGERGHVRGVLALDPRLWTPAAKPRRGGHDAFAKPPV